MPMRAAIVAKPAEPNASAVRAGCRDHADPRPRSRRAARTRPPPPGCRRSAAARGLRRPGRRRRRRPRAIGRRRMAPVTVTRPVTDRAPRLPAARAAKTAYRPTTVSTLAQASTSSAPRADPQLIRAGAPCRSTRWPTGAAAMPVTATGMLKAPVRVPGRTEVALHRQQQHREGVVQDSPRDGLGDGERAHDAPSEVALRRLRSWPRGATSAAAEEADRDRRRAGPASSSAAGAGRLRGRRLREVELCPTTDEARREAPRGDALGEGPMVGILGRARAARGVVHGGGGSAAPAGGLGVVERKADGADPGLREHELDLVRRPRGRRRVRRRWTGLPRCPW